MLISKLLVSKLFKFLENNKIFESIGKATRFYDEPPFSLYNSLLKNPNKNKDDLNILTASGLSFTSKHLALLKCLGESIERDCLTHYDKKHIYYSSYEKLNYNAFDPDLFRVDSNSNSKLLGWISGFNLTLNQKCLIPAQLIYLTYQKRKNEAILPQPNMSTGGAGGFTHESTLLRGIYEVIERDAFMCMYLCKVKAPRIKLNSIHNKLIQKITHDCKRYKIELYVFDITTDIGIPSFLSIAVDKTGIGPAVSCGLKSGLRIIDTLVGSIEESFLTRPWIREKIMKRRFIIPKINPKTITTHLERAFFWFSPKMLKKLDFLLNQQDNLILSIDNNFEGTSQEEFLKVKNLLQKKRLTVFYSDITLPVFKDSEYLVYKIVIPALQPFYLNENEKIIRMERLKSLSKYFGQKKFRINTIPHPFL